MNPTSFWRDETGNHVEGGGFTGAIGSQQTNDFAGSNREAYAFHDRAPAVDLAETVYLEDG